MTDQIFAGKLSLTDDIPEQPQPAGTVAEGSFTLGGRAHSLMRGSQIIADPPQPRPLPEPGLSPAARRVRAEAARLGIDYDAEVIKVLNRARGNHWNVLPHPGYGKAGPDPLKNVSDYDRRMAEHAAAENIRREHGIELTWEE